jgi:signal peptidase I
MKPPFKLIGVVLVLVVLRLIMDAPTVVSYDPLLLIVGIAAVVVLLAYELTQESTQLKTVGEQMFHIMYPSFVFFVVLYALINMVVFPARVNGTSMVPTYVSGDLVVFWMLGEAKPFDVVFVNITEERTEHFKDEFMLKRVIGVAGDRVDIQNGQLLLNGVQVVEPYVTSPMMSTSLPCFSAENCRTVPQGMVFVMGDNRNSSIDSRSYGLVPEADIIGRVILNVREVWPW